MEKLNESIVLDLELQNEKIAVVRNFKNNYEKFNEGNSIMKNIREEGENNVKQNINWRRHLENPQEEQSDNSTSGCEKIENFIEENLLKVKQKLIRNKSLRPFRSLSSSAIQEKRSEEEYMNEAKDSSNLNIKNQETESKKSNVNAKNNHGKTARGILFLNKKRKFFLNCLFGKAEFYKNIKKPDKPIFANSHNTKISIPFVSKSLDDVLLFYKQEIKIYADNSSMQNKILDNLKGNHLSEWPSDRLASNQESDYEMFRMLLRQKSHGKLSFTQTKSKEFNKKICFHQQLKKNNLSDIQHEGVKTNPNQNSNFDENVLKKDNFQFHNTESNLNAKNSSEEKISKMDTSKNFLHSSKAASHFLKTSSTEFLNHPSQDNKNNLKITAISETLSNSNKAPLSSLLSCFNSGLSAAATPSSPDRAAGDQSTPSGQGNSLVKESQSQENMFITAYKKTENLSSIKILKDKNLPQPQLYSSNGIVAEFSKKIGTYDENFQEQHNLGNQTQSNQGFLSKNLKNISSKINTELNTEKSLNTIPEPDNSIYLNYVTMTGKTAEYYNNSGEITPDKRNQLPHLAVPYCFLNEIDGKKSKSVVIPLEGEKECTSKKLCNFYINTNNDYDGADVDADKHNKELTKMCNFKANKEKEDLFYMSFKKQYIPVPKKNHENKDSSIKSGKIHTSNSSPNTPFDALIEDMSVINPNFLNKFQLKDSQNEKFISVAEDRIVKKGGSRIPELFESTEKDENETVSFIQDFHINLPNSFSERDRIGHFTEVMKNKTLQKSFQYGADSLRFELQYLDTIYTRRLEQAKKLTQNSSENYSIEEANLITSQSDNQDPVKEHKYSVNEPQNSYIYKTQNTMVNLTEIENDEANETSYKTNSLQHDYSVFRHPKNNYDSDTNSKWSYDSYQPNSEFNAILSKEFNRDYIPVRGKRVKLSSANEEMGMIQQVGNNDFRGDEKHRIVCNVQMSHRENEQEKNNECFNRNKQNDLVVNIFLTRQDPKSSKLSFNIKNKIEERLNKHSSKISVSISQESSDEVQEDEEDDEDELEVNANEEDDGRALAVRGFQLNKKPEQKLLPYIKDNNELKLNSEIPECKRALFPRIYSDFSIETKCNPVTYKYLLPNQP